MSNRENTIACNDHRAFCEAVAAHFVKSLQSKAADPETKVNIAVSGGSTPLAIWEWIARHFIEAVPWEQVNVFWVDERYVPLNSEQSNFYHAHRLLFRHTIATLFPYPVHLPLHEAADEYEQILSKHLPLNEQGLPVFDLVWLGMGTDGHIASIFPACREAIEERSRWVIGVEVPQKGPRLSLTLPVLAAARERMWVIGGQEKLTLLREAPHRIPPQLPVDHLRQMPFTGEEYFFLNQE